MSLRVSDITEVPLWKSEEGHSDTWFFQQLAAFASQRNSNRSNKLYSLENQYFGAGTPPYFPDVTVEGMPYAIEARMDDGGVPTSFFYSVYTQAGLIHLEYNAFTLVYSGSASTKTSADFNADNFVVNNGDGTYTLSPGGSGWVNLNTNYCLIHTRG